MNAMYTFFFFFTLCAFPILSPRLTFDLYLPQNIPVAAADDSGYGWYRALLFSSNSVRFCVKSDPSNYLKSKHFYWQSSIKKNLRAGWMFPHCRVIFSQRKKNSLPLCVLPEQPGNVCTTWPNRNTRTCSRCTTTTAAVSARHSQRYWR